MKLSALYSLPIVSLTLVYQGQSLLVHNVLVDTGAAATVLAADEVATVGILPGSEDMISFVHGVGGAETVYSRRVDAIQVGDISLTDFEIQIGAMDYGFDFHGILGMDFLTSAGAIIDLRQWEIQFS